jgi:hypothetical protein
MGGGSFIMRGSVIIKLKIRNVQYNLKLNRNYTVLQGDGSAGKTRFCKAIDLYNKGQTRGLTLSSHSYLGFYCRLETRDSYCEKYCIFH